MYLKQLEIIGFKSFAKKTTIDFDGNITGVVGPNGSGKSNVSDAIKWVLGEQRARQLRGEKMEDVIFNGTMEKRPLGYAQVSLLLDNSSRILPVDYEEVSISRRLYRSGESRYYINKTQCRLKDVQQLFMDTGLGKEGYSVIGQGQVQDLIEGSAQQKRLFIEEAVGIVKYKAKKNEAQNKLGRTQENLDRVEDIVAELERRIGPLKRQVEKAKKYLDLSEQLKERELNLFAHQTEKYGVEISKALGDKEIIEKDAAALQARFEEAEKRYYEYKDEVGAYDARINEINNALYALSDAMNSAQHQREESRLELARINAGIEERQHADVYIAEQLLSRQQQKAEYDEQCGVILQEAEQLQQRIVQQEEVVKEYQRRQELLLNGESEYRNLLFKIETIEGEVAQLTESLAKVQKEAEKYTLERQQLDELIKEKGVQYETYEQNALARRADYEAAQVEINDALQHIKVAQAQLSMLKANEEDMQGYGYAVKRILRAAKEGREINGVCGTVAELLRVEERYLKAVEAALGGAFKYVVVDDEKAAAECIRLLKKNRWGRVTFMPITAIRPSSLSEQERQLLGGEQFTIAASVIRCEAKYADIMKNILGRVLFVEDMRRAEALSKHTKNRFKIVTLGGEVFMPGGSIVGGEAKSDNPAPMMRKRRIDELERAIEVSRKTYEEKIQLNGGLKGELEESKQELDSLRASIAEKNVALAASDAGVRNCAQQLKSLQEQLEELGDKRAQTIEQKRFLEEQLEGNRDVEEIKSACRAEEEQLNELRLKAATLDEKKINIAGQAMKYAQEISALTHRREESAEKVAQLNARMIELKQLLSTEEVHNADYERRRDALKQSYEELTRAKAEKSELYDKANRDVVTLSKEKNDINDDLNRLLIKINNAQIKMEHLQQAMLEQYQITAEEAGQYKRPIENVELYAAERDELKQKITSLGNINVGALEEYEEVSQRYEFLIAQRDDLIAAKADIESIIEDIEKSMAEQFKARFGLIQQEFDVAFKKLFRGGTAEIGIEDEEDLMSTGIVISAQPPGKKLKNMNMLSGGEKALTAIALLFAILKIKPAPFCVLDEIDAALDENNVVRLTEYIDEMRKSNQFIIITHKRRTMEICDCIYGASMGSDGVTQIISLKLDRETEEAI